MSDPAYLALLEAQRHVALWQQPVVHGRDVPVLLQLPEAAWRAAKSKLDINPVQLGKRAYWRTCDLRKLFD